MRFRGFISGFWKNCWENPDPGQNCMPSRDEKPAQLKHFHRFLTGGLCAMGGLFALVGSNMYLPPSLNQEIFALGAIAIASAGLFLAATGYWGLLRERLKGFGRRQDDEFHDN